MLDDGMKTIAAMAASMISLAIIAVLVSRNSNTSGVLQAAGSAYANILKVAISPVAGGGGSSGGSGSSFFSGIPYVPGSSYNN